MPPELNHISVIQKLNYHTSDVTTCDFGKDLHLASGSGDKSVCVWEWKPGLGFVDTTYSPLTGHKYSVTSVRFSPEGSLLASASIDGTAIVWNVKTGESITTFVHSGGNGVRTCCFSKNNFLATAGDDGTICLWDLLSRSLVRSVVGHEETVQSICFSPDSACLLTGDVGGQLKLWSSTSFSGCLSVINDAHDLGVLGIDFAPTYQQSSAGKNRSRVFKVLSCGTDHLVKLWNVYYMENEQLDRSGSFECIAQFAGHSSAVTGVCFDGTGSFAASSSLDKTARLWDITTKKCLKVLEGHSRFVACCAFSRDQTLLATGSNDKSLLIWALMGSISIESCLVKPSNPAASKGREETVMKKALMENNQVKLWQRLDTTNNCFNSCDFLGNCLLAAGGSGRNVLLWRKKNDRFVEADLSPLEGHRYTINQLEFSSDGKLLATCSLDGTALIWDVQTGSVLRNGFQVSGGGMRTARFSPDCRLLITGGDDELVSIYRTDTCELVIVVSFQQMQSPKKPPYGVIPEYEEEEDKEEGEAFQQDVTISPLEQKQNQEVELQKVFIDYFINYCCLDGEKRYLLATCGNDSLVKMWQIQVIDELSAKVTLSCQLSGHGGNVTCVRFSPGQSEVLASTATDKTCRIWDAYTGECVHVLDQHDSVLTCCAFSADASFLATGSLDKSVLVWELPKELAFQNFVASRVKDFQKETDSKAEYVSGVVKLFTEENLPPPDLDEINLYDASPNEILQKYEIDEDLRNKMSTRLVVLMRREKASTLNTPEEFTCPITHQLMREPVMCVDGYNYERSAIESWFASGRETSPMTNAAVQSTTLIPNQKLQQAISEFLNH
ncbi:WD repeat, SAM and U-box domain-containing protein 1 [Nilaparvata lugens]|uniref:WD repeat, SAM and U-box domain-containing protein 1 n=1 Tax=Nilaparvata lugens TaxID=108931 RepID=UPI00193D2390|nr:WD repeat, SAM and U-box domain-containing protein 1 [Nilaparvata lugens]